MTRAAFAITLALSLAAAVYIVAVVESVARINQTEWSR